MRFFGAGGGTLEAVRKPFEVLEGGFCASEGKLLMVGVTGTAIVGSGGRCRGLDWKDRLVSYLGRMQRSQLECFSWVSICMYNGGSVIRCFPGRK